MPVVVDTSHSAAAIKLQASNCITIGLINNMPDAALEATERQFADLVRAAAADVVVRLLLFSIAEVPRSDYARQEMAERYRDVSELWNTELDGLIVTGTEPRAKNLKDEPYWQTLARVIDWARENTASTIWSCLAAHAAVLHTDGIERHALADKMFGVFECESAVSHPMTARAVHGLRVPHSRYNDLSGQALSASGYRVLTRSAEAGVDMFARQEQSFHLFLQGHPEYEANTLLREYRRDVARFLRRERDTYPALPQGYFTDAAAAIAAAFRLRAVADRREHLISSFPFGVLETELQSPWRDCAIGIYETWVGYLTGRKAEQRPVRGPRRRSWRDWPAGIARQTADSPAN
jgi:homoserine O-succinyltransferase/O-acetyltransferase